MRPASTPTFHVLVEAVDDRDAEQDTAEQCHAATQALFTQTLKPNEPGLKSV